MNVRSVIFDVIGRDKASAAFLSASRSAEKAAVGVDRSIARMNAAGAKTAAIGSKLTKGLTLPLAALGAVSLDQAVKFQKSMTLIQTAGGETAAKTAVISKGIKQVAVETGTSLDQLGHGIYLVAKAGAQKWSAIEQLQVLKVAAQGAKAEQVDLATATDALTTVMLDYHVGVKDAVTYENMLIRGSGLAKTTFQEFSSSLSNVVPIAAAAGVSLKEVIGAIATMTQHGVSPQQATENARNLLFNLQGANNVASAAMQQLGINTVDLAKNLGKRGLAGSLAIVDRALKAHTHNGLVVVDVHKAAALATKSLATELGAMSGKLRAQSEGLLKGAVSIKDYTKFAKSMGGEAGAAALQFLALYKNNLGFSNQLRSGQGVVSTTTQQYQKMLGGMTGASVAMQIGGKYAKDNARNVREVGKAALEAGSDVLGWNKTQQTLAVKLDKAKASLQVMAVEIGTALIPAVAKMVGWVQSAVRWFDGLSAGWKKFLGIAALTVAVLGPVVYVVGKVTRAIAAMWAVGLASTRFVAGMRAAVLAEKSMATVSYATGLKVRAAMIGIRESLLGLSIIGGVAIAGYALGRALSSIVDHGKQAFTTIGNLAQITGTYRDILVSTNGALNDSVRLQVGKQLQDDGLAAKAAKAGISLRQLEDAVTGSDASLAGLLKQWRKLGASDDTLMTLILMHRAFSQADTSAKDLAGSVGGVGDAATTAAKKLSPAATAMQKRITAIQTAITNLKQNKVPNVDINTYDASAKLAGLQLQLQQALAAMNVLAGGSPHDVFNDLPGQPGNAVSPTKTKSTVHTPSPSAPSSVLGGSVLTGSGGTGTAGASAAASTAKTKSDAAKQAIKDAMAARVRAAQDRLTAAKQKYSDEKTGIRSAITGSFDVTTAGQNQFGEPVTFSAIRRQLQKAVANAKKFTAVLKKLGREGLNKALLSQLALAGPSALPEALALASATPKQLAAFNSQYRQLTNAGNSAGTYVADKMYGAGVKSAQGLVNGLKSQQSEINKAIRNMADGMIAQLRRSLNMHSPSRRLYDEARLAFSGYENGIQSKHADIARAAHGVGDASVPGRGGARRSGGGVTVIQNNDLHVHYPLDGDLTSAVKTLTRMSARQLREAGEALGV